MKKENTLESLALEMVEDKGGSFTKILEDLNYLRKTHTPQELVQLYRESKGICYDGEMPKM